MCDLQLACHLISNFDILIEKPPGFGFSFRYLIGYGITKQIVILCISKRGFATLFGFG